MVDKGQAGVVTGSQKLVQDIRAALLERMGTDDLHPDFGSVLDGGVQDGVEVDGIIGEVDPELIRTFVSTEINRIIDTYRDQQIARAQADQLTYAKSTLSPDESIAETAINMGMIQDMLVIQIVITTESGDSRSIAIPFTV